MRRVVTISRQYGAGGLQVGRRVAERLGADFLDSRLVEEVARRMEFSAEEVRRWDERSEGLILRLLRALQSVNPEFAAAGTVEGAGLTGPTPAERIVAGMREVILEEARTRDAVIVGRGAVLILAGRPGVTHVRLIADREDRAARIGARAGLGGQAALEQIDRADRGRAAYIRQQFGEEIDDPHHFTMVLNTSRMSFEEAADLIVAIAGPRRGR